MKKDKIKFIKQSVYFMLILILLTSFILALPYYIFFMSKEHFSTDKVLNEQKNLAEDFLFGDAYVNEQSLYKLKLVNSNNCDVLVLGTSRVMQFRSSFFNESFCNAGGAIYGIEDIIKFLNNINKNNLPKLLIIGLDQNFFHERWKDDSQNFVEENKFLILNSNIVKIYTDFFKDKIDLKKLSNNSQVIGLSAIMNGNGFRTDGSYFYNYEITQNNSINIRVKNALNEINSSNGRGVFVKHVNFSNKSIENLNLLFEFCLKNNISVIGFTPPYAKEVWQEIEHDNSSYQYLFEIENKVLPIFENYGYEFYDISSLDTINASNCEVIDGLHGSEKVYLRILIYFAKHGTLLNNYIDLTYLENKLSLSKDCFNT